MFTKEEIQMVTDVKKCSTTLIKTNNKKDNDGATPHTCQNAMC